VIIGQWSVPALDSGLYQQEKAALDWSFPQAVPTQAIRARQAARVSADFFNEPYLVGAHWFICGDFDSPEREANRGLVPSDGQPWDELVRELRAVHRDIQDHTLVGHPPRQVACDGCPFPEANSPLETETETCGRRLRRGRETCAERGRP
jgi:hypothetical protein